MTFAPLKVLPDYVEVLPGAYSGSVCGKSRSGKPWSIIRFEKHDNKAFRIGDEDEFVRTMTSSVPPVPPQAAALRALNARAEVAAA